MATAIAQSAGAAVLLHDGHQKDSPVPHAPSVPVIDLSGPDAQVAEELRNACIKYGFFTIANHGIEESLVEAIFEQNKKFFALPFEEKMKIAAKNVSHYRLYFGREVPATDPEASKALTGPNQWPSQDLLPDYRAVTEAYMAAMEALGLRLVRLIALALRCPADFFDAAFIKALTVIRPLHYNDEVSDPVLGLFGAGAHTDYGMITILKTDEEGGLQMNLDGIWVDINPIPGTFIVNIGDMLQVFSNGLFRSKLHRVLGRGRERYSIPFFFEPHPEARVECLATCCSPDNPAQYTPTTSGQHILDKYKQTHAGYIANTETAA